MSGSESRASLATPSLRWKSLIRWSQIVSNGVKAGLPEFKVPPSSGRSSFRFSSHMPRSWSTPVEPWTLACDASVGAGFSKLLLDLLPHLNTYGAVSTFRCLRDTLWPMEFPVYASIMLFPHPSVCVTSGFMLFTRCLPRHFDELANMTATLGSFYWLGFETSGLSPDKKRLALLGAQQFWLCFP